MVFIRIRYAPFIPSDKETAREMLKLANLKEGETLYDLGSGDGIILFVGAEEFGARCIGIERDKNLVKQCKKEIKKRNLQSRVKVIHGDFYSSEFWSYENPNSFKPYTVSNADVITLYLVQEACDILKPKLEKELKVGTRVITRSFPIKGWKALKRKDYLYLYEVGKSFKNR